MDHAQSQNQDELNSSLLSELLPELEAKYNSWYGDEDGQQEDPFDQFISDAIESDPDRVALLAEAESSVRLPLEALFPIEEFLDRRFRYLQSGSFGSALLLERGRRRTPTVLKCIVCLPAALSGILQRQTGMRYADIAREIRCMRVLAKLSKGVVGVAPPGSEEEGEDDRSYGDGAQMILPATSRTVHYKAGCFPHLSQVYLVDTARAQMYFEAFYSNQPGTAAYPRLEKAILSQEHCGVGLLKALSSRRFVTSHALLSVYKQVILGLVAAERAFQFEHRDLHVSNLMVRDTAARVIRFELGTHAQYTLPSHGSEAKIIDFTYSRLTTPEGVDLYKDLSSLYDVKDAEYSEDAPDYLDGYKDMHRARSGTDRQDWRPFSPASNLAWIKRFTRECIETLDKNRETMLASMSVNPQDQPDSEPGQNPQNNPTPALLAFKRAATDAKLQVVRDYLARLLALTTTCSITEQFLSGLLSDEYNQARLVQIKVKALK